MNMDHEFDKAAREKLAGRSFTPGPGDWESMAELLATDRRRRRAGWWYTLAAAALLAPMAWLLLRGGGTAHGPVTQAPMAAPVAPASTAAAVQAANTTPADAAGPAVEPMRPEAAPGAPAEHSAQHARQGSTADVPTAKRQRNRASSMGTVRTANNGPAMTVGPAPSTGAYGPALRASGITAVTTRNEDATQRSGTSGDSAQSHPPPVAQTTAGAVAEAGPAAPERKDTTAQAAKPATDVTDAIAAGTAVVAPARDSANTAAPPSIEAITMRPWAVEIAGLAGAWASAPGFAGAGTEPWRNDLRSRPSPGWGLEATFQRGWFGIGTGIQAVAYMEALRQDRIENSTTYVNTFYGLIQVPASITIVTDTIFQGSNTYYVTESVDTLLNVLTTDRDTTTTTTVQREGIDRVNRVSYVEIPLLLDLRASVGRWTLGARGGPHVALRTGQRTVLPDASGLNNAFADGTFRGAVAGWNVRLYARYRVCDRWSIGLEPGMRGSFGDVMDAQGISRRNAAWGAWLSVSHRLR